MGRKRRAPLVQYVLSAIYLKATSIITLTMFQLKTSMHATCIHTILAVRPIAKRQCLTRLERAAGTSLLVSHPTSLPVCAATIQPVSSKAFSFYIQFRYSKPYFLAVSSFRTLDPVSGEFGWRQNWSCWPERCGGQLHYSDGELEFWKEKLAVADYIFAQYRFVPLSHWLSDSGPPVSFSDLIGCSMHLLWSGGCQSWHPPIS